jgi:hypothetical protein
MLHACLYTICLVFCYTSWRFYVFFGTNLLTRCHIASSLFSVVFVFQKSYIENILGIGWNKSRTSYFYRSFTKTEDETEGGQRLATPQGAQPSPWAHPPMVSPPGPTSDNAPSPIKTPHREKPKWRIAFPRNIIQAATVVESRSGGSRSSSRHPAGGLLHHHGRLRSDVWVVYLGLWVHSSS